MASRSRPSWDADQAYIAQTVHHHARRLIGRYGIVEDDREDLEQDLLLDLLCRLPHYDPAKSDRRTFVARLTVNCIRTIIEKRRAAKRGGRFTHRSLSEELYPESNDPLELQETISTDDHQAFTQGPVLAGQERLEMGLRCREALARLTPLERAACLLLSRLTVAEAAATLGLARTTLNDILCDMRARLHGLESCKFPSKVPSDRRRLRYVRLRDRRGTSASHRRQQEEPTMMKDTYRYRFPPPVEMAQVEETLLLATMAAEGLHGRSRVQLEAKFQCDAATRTAEIVAGTEVGEAIARVFTALLNTTIGESAFKVERIAKEASQ